VSDDSPERPAPVAEQTPAFDSMPVLVAAAAPAPVRRTSGMGALLAVFLTCALLGGLTYGVMFRGWSLESLEAFRHRSPESPAPPAQTADAAVTPLPSREMTEVVLRETPQAPLAQRANILIFTARPGSIATSRPTTLCYAVSDAARARIEPGVGDVDPAATLTCRRVTPARTTTYELSATGRDGIPVTQHLVIFVR